MDEPTEHLDEETAAALTADLLAATRGRTTVLITHRSLPLADVDQMVSFDGGRITVTEARLPAPRDRRGARQT
jgi:ATP-binding cassette subfamily C protein CydCD